METKNRVKGILKKMEEELNKSQLALLAKTPNQLICNIYDFSDETKEKIKKLVPFITELENFYVSCGELVSIEKKKKLLYRTDVAVSRSNTKLTQINKTLIRLIEQIESLDSRTIALLETNALVARNSSIDKLISPVNDSLLDEVFYLSAGVELSIYDNTGEHVAKPLSFISDIYNCWLKFGGKTVESNDRGSFFNLVKILLSEADLDNECPSYLISKAIN
jgi:hypothetical protein